MDEALALPPASADVAGDPAASPDQPAECRAEVDTSAPFESVREAVDRFGGAASWSRQLRPFLVPTAKKHEAGIEHISLEEQTAALEKELVTKEMEALEVLKELDMTKRIIAELKSAVQNATADEEPSCLIESTVLHTSLVESVQDPQLLVADEEMKAGNDAAEEHVECLSNAMQIKETNVAEHTHLDPVLIELNHAKLSLRRATTDLAAIRASVQSLSTSIAKERILLQRSREKLAMNTAVVTSLEDSLNLTTEKLNTLSDLQKRSKDPLDIFTEIKMMAAEVEGLRNLGSAARSEVIQLMAEIEQMRASIATAEIQCQAAKKMEAAARTAESLALAEINALTCSENLALNEENTDGVTMLLEEYFKLISNAQEADQNSQEKVECAMHQIDEANHEKLQYVQKLEDAKAEARACKIALEEALKRIDAANKGKFAVEEALRRWRSEHGHRRHSGSVKFKTSGGRRCKNGIESVTEGHKTYQPTLSIGQILSLKLMGPEEYVKSVSNKEADNSTVVSLGQILSRKHRIASMDDEAVQKHISGKRKKAFVGISLLLSKQNMGKKKRPFNSEEVVKC